MIVAMAGLESGKTTSQETIIDPGYFFLGRAFNDWQPGGHGNVNLVRAIKVSCDTYFYQLGYRVGIEVSGHDNHAVFVAFAPYDNPEIAVAVVMEFAGHGGTAAGPVEMIMLILPYRA